MDGRTNPHHRKALLQKKHQNVFHLNFLIYRIASIKIFIGNSCFKSVKQYHVQFILCTKLRDLLTIDNKMIYIPNDNKQNYPL